MCGLGRHGVEPAKGGTGCFLSECWDLQPDIVTFGKSIGGGAGHLLSGAILLDGASKLQARATAPASHLHRMRTAPAPHLHRTCTAPALHVHLMCTARAFAMLPSYHLVIT